jgi:hypothetical protein
MYIKINNTQIPATIQTRQNDTMWQNRETKAITLEITYEEALSIFVNDLKWSTVVEMEEGLIETDMSVYALAGPITDNRNGTITVKMGKYSEDELMQIPLGETPRSHAEALTLRAAIEIAATSLDDATASTAAALFPVMKYDGALVKAGTRINWHGTVKRAATDLWDTMDNNPDNAPTLWEDLNYKEGHRIIPEIITVGTAFALGELGWWKDELYESLLEANVYTPETYPAGWKLV